MEKFKKVLYWSHFVALGVAAGVLLYDKNNFPLAFFVTQAAYLLYRFSGR